MALPKAQAIIFPDKDRVEIGSFELPEIQPDEALVRTEFSRVSQGTEIWALIGKRPEIMFPTVPGYQSIGVVEEAFTEAPRIYPRLAAGDPDILGVVFDWSAA